VPYGRWEVTDVTEGFELALGCIEARALLAVLGYFCLGTAGSGQRTLLPGRSSHCASRWLLDTQPREATHGAAK
jgi:hypothetical protein